MKKGKFIVIDGTDGSGKATQTKLLVNRLRKAGKKVRNIDFPRYYNNFFGKTIGQCLIGENGNWAKINPRIASIIYAADRWESSAQIRKWLAQGHWVIADRYVSSNQIHQGGKVLEKKKRKEFLDWLDELEFEVFKIPRPDAIVYLDVPYEISKRLMESENKGQKKKYLKGKKDLHEADQKHMLNAKKSALALVKERNNWIRINCAKKSELMSIQEIETLVWKAVEVFID